MRKEVRRRSVRFALPLGFLPPRIQEFDPDMVGELVDGNLLAAEGGVRLCLLLRAFGCMSKKISTIPMGYS